MTLAVSRPDMAGDRHEEHDAAAEAFEAVRAEVAQLRHAVERLTTVQAAVEQPDYAVTLGEITHNLAVTAKRTEALAKSPALLLTPVGIGAQINVAAAEVRRGEQQMLDQARSGLQQAARELAGRVKSARAYDEQRLWVIGAGVTGLVSGALLLWGLARPIARAMPEDWMWPERMAARTLDRPMWEAGARLMANAPNTVWPELVAAWKLQQANDAALAKCWKAAGRARKAVLCTIKVGGEN